MADIALAPAPESFAAHLLAEAPPVETPTPLLPETPAPADLAAPDAPDVEAASVKPDADLSEAAKTLRRNRADERKAKIQAEISASVKEREDIRAEVSRLKAERDGLRAVPVTAKAAQTSDPTDAKPTLDQFEDFNAFVDARDEWVLRESARRTTTAEHHAAQRRAEQESATVLVTRGQASREKYSDYDSVIEPVIAEFNDNPRARAVAEFVAQSEVGGDLVYRLGKDPTLLRSVVTAESPIALARALARVEATLVQPVSAVLPVTKAPAPPSQTVGGHASAVSLDTRKGVSLADHIRVEEAELTERRRLGYRI